MWYIVCDSEGELLYEGYRWPKARTALDHAIKKGNGCPALVIRPEADCVPESKVETRCFCCEEQRECPAFDTGVVYPCPDFKKAACCMCVNAHTDPELSSDNDLSYFGIGHCDGKHRLLLRSGDNRPTEILVEEWGEHSRWSTIGYYRPAYCPNCGRKLKENE